jgi:hypothetical protein
VKGKLYLKENGYTCWFDIFFPPYVRIQATNNAPDTPSSNWVFYTQKKRISNWGITDKTHGREERSRCGRCAGSTTRTVLTLPHPRVQFGVSAPTTARPHAWLRPMPPQHVVFLSTPHRPASHPAPSATSTSRPSVPYRNVHHRPPHELLTPGPRAAPTRQGSGATGRRTWRGRCGGRRSGAAAG